MRPDEKCPDLTKTWDAAKVAIPNPDRIELRYLFPSTKSNLEDVPRTLGIGQPTNDGSTYCLRESGGNLC